MKFGIRECVDVVMRAKTAMKIGSKVFYANEPVCYFDSLKTSTLEGSGTTVYAQGGRGNARLTSWDGERAVTFTMEDALISPIGLSILTGAGLIEASSTSSIIQHVVESVTIDTDGKIKVTKEPYQTAKQDTIYVMLADNNGEVISEPYIGTVSNDDKKTIEIASDSSGRKPTYSADTTDILTSGTMVVVDYYTEHTSGAMEIQITPDEFGGTFYLEGSTLWRDAGTGKDLPAEIIIPKCRVQSNFSFTMASSGDPSSFTFTIDAFPDFTRFNKNKKVLADIQVIGVTETGTNEYVRVKTESEDGDYFSDGVLVLDKDDDDDESEDRTEIEWDLDSEESSGTGSTGDNTETTGESQTTRMATPKY